MGNTPSFGSLGSLACNMGEEVQKEVTGVGYPKVVGKVYAFRFWSDIKTVEVADSKINRI